MGERTCLIWSNFPSFVINLFKNLHKNHEFTDVTLITDDQHQFKVHKLILSINSSVFSKIFTSNPVSKSVFLTGISHVELEKILQFIYLGEVSFPHEQKDKFLNVAKYLGITQVYKNDKEGNWFINGPKQISRPIGISNKEAPEDFDNDKYKNESILSSSNQDKENECEDTKPVLNKKNTVDFHKSNEETYSTKNRTIQDLSIESIFESIFETTSQDKENECVVEKKNFDGKNTFESNNETSLSINMTVQDLSFESAKNSILEEKKNYKCQLCDFKARKNYLLKLHV